MCKLGFSPRWTQLVMTCVRTVSYSVIVNGKPVGNFRPSRGIRQGDPISPYLFLICAEALSSLLHHAVQSGTITGVPTSPRGPYLSHLFFADDSLIFCKANSVEWRRILKILEVYEGGSGQKLNFQKTAIIFSQNVSLEKRSEILQLFGLLEANRFDSYLGLPSLVGRSKMQAFASIKERVGKKLNNWKVKFLSQAGKEILLKAVVQAIPTYSMSIFLLPVGLCKELNHMMQEFWWGHMANNSKIHWMSWKRMGYAKSLGGLGFRDLTMFNKALLAKQLWRLHQRPDSLAGRILKAKYFPNSSILEASLGTRPSFAWRSMHAALDLLKQGLVWRVGDGRSIQIWGDRWFPSPSTFLVQSPPRLLPLDSKVSCLIDQDTKNWDLRMLSELFNEEEARVISNIPLSPTSPKDRLIWQGTSNGLFSVRSAYHLGMEMLQRYRATCSYSYKGRVVWKVLWNLKVPNTVKIFMWRACNSLLPTKENLCRRGVVKDPLCPCCELEVETTSHALWFCPASRDVWGCGPKIFQKSSSMESSFLSLFEGFLGRFGSEELDFMAIVARRIWLRRNSVVFEGVFTSPFSVFSSASEALSDFRKCHQQVLAPQSQPASLMPPQLKVWLPPPRGLLK
jgi:hypothetical protein